MASITEASVPKLGQMLLARNAITRAQLDAAIAKQRIDGRPLGEILLADNVVSARQLRRSLTLQSWLRKALQVASLSMVSWQAAQASDADAFALDPYAAQMQQSGGDLWDAIDKLESSSSGVAADVRDSNRSTRRRWEADIRDAIGEPAYILLKGRYSGNADGVVEGLRYTVKWKTDSVKVEFKYSF